MKKTITLNGEKLIIDNEDNTNNISFPNVEDWKENFWKHNYLVLLGEFGSMYAVNADNEQDAIDYVIDYCVENHPGLIMSREEEEEEEFLDDYICGGNEGRYLNTMYIRIIEI